MGSRLHDCATDQSFVRRPSILHPGSRTFPEPVTCWSAAHVSFVLRASVDDFFFTPEEVLKREVDGYC